MKRILSTMAILVFTLTFSVAYADLMPQDRAKEPGAYYGVVSPKSDADFQGAALGGTREEKGVVHGYSIIDTLSPSEFTKDWGAKGVAAGGMRSDEIGFSIIDTLSPTGVSRDLP